jgi:hypothetical protein
MGQVYGAGFRTRVSVWCFSRKIRLKSDGSSSCASLVLEPARAGAAAMANVASVGASATPPQV